MTIDRELTIFCIAFLIFFILPIAIILTALVNDWRNRDHDQVTNDQMTMTNDQLTMTK